MKIDWDANALYFTFELSKVNGDIMEAFRLPKYLITEASFPKKKKKGNDAKETKDRRVITMTDAKRKEIAKSLLETFRIVWCDRGTDFPPYFNCSVCEFEDGEHCRLKLFIINKDRLEGGDTE